MKLTIEQPRLATLIQRVIGAVEKRNTIAVLSNVLLSTNGDHLQAKTTDLDMEVTSRAPASTEEEGATTVNAALLAAIVGKMSKGALITIKANENTVWISNDKAEFELATLPVEDFPELASPEYAASFDCPADDLKRLFDLSAFAMSTEETRYYLNGVYLHPADGTARAVTTDGHRLARIDSVIAADFPGVIVPRKMVQDLRKLLGDADDVTVSVSATKIRFDMGDTVITSKVIDGTFPDYTRVIPAQWKHVVTADADEMKQATDLVALVSGERTKAVKMSFQGGKCELQVASGADKGQQVVACETGDATVEIGFNSKYLAELMQVCPGDAVRFKLSGSGDAAIVEPAEGDGVLYVCMPCRW